MVNEPAEKAREKRMSLQYSDAQENGSPLFLQHQELLLTTRTLPSALGSPGTIISHHPSPFTFSVRFLLTHSDLCKKVKTASD